MSPAAVDEEEVVNCWWWERKEIITGMPLLMKIEEETVSCWGNCRRCWWKGSRNHEHWWLEWRLDWLLKWGKRRIENWTMIMIVTVIIAAFVVAGWLIKEGDWGFVQWKWVDGLICFALLWLEWRLSRLVTMHLHSQ